MTSELDKEFDRILTETSTPKLAAYFMACLAIAALVVLVLKL